MSFHEYRGVSGAPGAEWEPNLVGDIGNSGTLGS